MVTGYTAWNGEDRPWPPPENWYRAADGRWYHPAHGPENPPDADDDLDEADHTPTVRRESTGSSANRLRNRTADDGAEEPRDALPVWETTSQTDDGDTTVEPNVGHPQDAAVVHNEETVSRSEPAPSAGEGPRAGSRSGRSWTTAAVIGVIVLGIAILAQVMISRSGTDVTSAADSDDADTPAATEGTEDSATTASTVTTENTEDTGVDGDETDDSAADTTALTDTDVSAVDADQGAAGADDTPEADPEVAAKIAGFRLQLRDRDLVTDELTDNQITTFASTYCVYAAGAEDRAAFDELRQVAVATSASDLTPAQLNLTITAAIITFCPDESERLGITYDTSPDTSP